MTTNVIQRNEYKITINLHSKTVLSKSKGNLTVNILFDVRNAYPSKMYSAEAF